MLHQFKDKKNTESQLKTVRDSAAEIDRVLTSTSLEGTVNSDWSKVKTELGTISKAFGMDTPAIDAAAAK